MIRLRALFAALLAFSWIPDVALAQEPPRVATPDEVKRFFDERGKTVVTFVGYSGSGYEDVRAMLDAAREELARHDPQRTIVNIAATAVGIGAVYEIAKETGFETTGIVSSLARESGAELSPHVDVVFIVEDETWGGSLEGTEVLSPKSRAMVESSDVVIGIGGGAVARDEMLTAQALGKTVRYVPADKDHRKAIEKARAKGLPTPTNFRGEASELAPAAPARTDVDEAGPADPHPLRPADTSSPRDTLKSFLTNANVAIDAWKLDEARAEGFRARHRAAETLDLGKTPHGDSSAVQAQRVLLLKEILDRIELPPYREIPGDAQVADGSITRWTIPDTAIAIVRVETGPREGEFLFSAGSVARLDRYYRQVKDLPYKPGASAGIYETFLQSDRSEFAQHRAVRQRLKPIDASTPRSTLEEFLDSVNRSYALVVGADAALRQEPPAITNEQARVMDAAADNLLRRARGALDLSRVPAAIRENAGVEAVLQLKEVLDRMPLPPLESVPGASSVQAHRASQRDLPFRWRIPDTRLEIVEIMEGDRAGEFLFGAATVGQIGRTYEELEDLPYRAAGLAGVSSDYLSPGTSVGFYDTYISTPGHLVPLASRQGRFIDALPDSLKTLRGGQTGWQWIGLLLSLVVLYLAAVLVFRVVRWVAGELDSPWSHWITVLTPVVVAVMVRRFEQFVDAGLNISGEVLSVVKTADEVIVLALVVWATFQILRALAETLIVSPRMVRVSDQSLNASLIRIAARVVAFLAGAWIVVDGIRNIGLDVVPLLAGLGVGGLAVALAAQTTFANFIGSLILFANKPVREGDFCRYGDQVGTVEEIGLHSTRIRSLERTIVTVPNAEFSEMQLENITKRDRRLFRPTLRLRYETTPEQLRYVVANVRALLLGHPKVTPDPARARFVGYGEYSKDIEIFAYLYCQDQSVFLAIQEDILLRIEDIVAEAGTSFAVPAQVEYQAPDPGLDAERGAEVEAQVGQWRNESRLPFPEFDAEERRKLTDSLDYPQEGSPDYRPRSETGPDSDEPSAPKGGRSRWFRRS